MRRVVTYRTVFLAFIAVYVATFFTEGPTGCAAYAAGTQPQDYCYQTHVHITYSGSGTVTNQPVRVLMPAAGMINAGQLDPRGWDGLFVAGNFSNEIEVQQQSMTSNQAPWWFMVPSLESGIQQEIFFYSGNGEIRNDGGVYFTGNEYITATHDSAMNVSDDLQINIRILNLADTARTGIILDHQLAGSGYTISFRDVASALTLRFQIDSTACDLAWNSAWTGSEQDFRFSYIAAAGADAFIYRNGTLEQSCDLDEGTIGGAFQELIIGAQSPGYADQLSNAVLRHVDVLEAGTVVVRYGFDPRRSTETNSTNPFQGTFEDYSGNGFTGNYIFDRDQANFSYEVQTTIANSLTPEFHTSTSSNPVVGNPVPSGFENSRTPSSSGLIYSLILSPIGDVATATGAPVEGVTVAFIYVISIVLAAIVWRLTGGYMPAAVLTMGVLPSLGLTLGWISYWWLLIWGLTTAVVWFAQLRSQQSA